MTYTELRPHPALQPHIATYFFLQTGAGSNVEELVIPDGTHGLMFVQNGSYVRSCPFVNLGQSVTGSRLFGQKTQPVRYSFDSKPLTCFGVKFHPHGLRAFTQLPSSELSDGHEEASAIWGNAFSELENRLFETATLHEKRALLDGFFLKNCLPPDPLVQEMLKQVHKQQGQLEIADLLQKFNLHYKRLERLFKKHVGLSPKTYCRLTRFNATLLHHARPKAGNLTQLAYESGYFDQMHFIKEVKHFTHLTPKAFYNSALGNIASHQRQLLSERLS